eukprot:1948152-Rhodomonas_salina.1
MLLMVAVSTETAVAIRSLDTHSSEKNASSGHVTSTSVSPKPSPSTLPALSAVISHTALRDSTDN